MRHCQIRLIAKTQYYLAFIIEQLIMENQLKVVPPFRQNTPSKSTSDRQNDPQADPPSSSPNIDQQKQEELPSNSQILPSQPPITNANPSNINPADLDTSRIPQDLALKEDNKQNQQKSQEAFIKQNQIQENEHFINQEKGHKSEAYISEREISQKDISHRQISEQQNLILKNHSKSEIISEKKKRKNQKSYFYDEEDNSEVIQVFKFPYINQYLKEHSTEYLQTIQKFDKAKDSFGLITSDSYLNCDVRYFNWQLFTQEVGKFEVILIDPPWRIKGAQQNDSQFMFSNCKFSLEYNTMANSQIARIPLQLLSNQGFIFLWILNSQLDASVEIMQKWGYELVEEIIWVKLKDEKINLTHGYYFMHSYEVCLVGYKCNKNIKEGQKMKIRPGITWNTVFAQVRQKSQKPQDIYAIIDIMFQSNKKIQIFARNHNLRFGILSMGNQLGQSYDKWLLKLSCDRCGQVLQSGKKRFKSKHQPNYDLCQKCIPTQDKSKFFELANDVDENIRHEYVSCNHCGSEPIWGIRFQCITCHDFDICQNCYDKNLQKEHNFHPIDHEYMFLEVPVFGNGFHIHEFKCSSCYQNPIIGIHFNCSTCKNFNLCQKCYFERPSGYFTSSNKRHKPDHQLQVVFQPQMQEDKKYECFGCKRQILEHCWMCQNCYNFFFCEKCFENKTDFKSLYANTHKQYHVMTKIF